jgi:Holliday junction resolvase RusA-like endonuclease
MTSLTITLPPPNPILSPNSRSHWATKMRQTRAHRLLAAFKTRSIIGREKPHGWLTARCQVTAYHTTTRRRDGDNLLNTCKAYFDGIADTGVIANDSGLIHHPCIFKIDRQNPRIEITITQEP